jgi:uncharacterized protein (TIGR00288 family)
MFGKGQPKIAVFVDGPNMIRKEFSISLAELRKTIQKHGRITVAKMFFNQFAPPKLLEAAAAEGFEVRVMPATEEKQDVDVPVAVAAVKASFDKRVDIIALVTRDSDYLPVVQLAKEMGKKVLVVGADVSFSKALQNSADFVEILGKTSDSDN